MLNTKLKKYLYYIPILLIVVLVVCGLVLRDNEKLSYINTFLLLISIFVAIVYVIVIRIKSKNNKLNKNKIHFFNRITPLIHQHILLNIS